MSNELTPQSLHGKRLELRVNGLPSPYRIAWRVRSYGSGMVRLVTERSKRYESVEWPELRNYIVTGRIEVKE